MTVSYITMQEIGTMQQILNRSLIRAVYPDLQAKINQVFITNLDSKPFAVLPVMSVCIYLTTTIFPAAATKFNC